MKILNLGCGTEKITGAINVDLNPKTGCDLTFDIKQKFPLEDNSFDKVCLFHCIEHVEKYFHFHVLYEIHRILVPDGIFLLSYPEFGVIIENWLKNRKGERKFWEATIYGRQLYPGDYHFAAIHTPNLIQELQNIGFNVDKHFSEPNQDFNTVIHCTKGEIPPTYEEILYNEVFGK